MTVDFVVHNSQKPWFVNLWLNDIHDPWAPDDESLSDVMGKGESSDDDRMLASLVKMDKRSEEHTSELQSLMRISYAVFCLKKKKQHKQKIHVTSDYRNTILYSTSAH